MHNAYDVAKSMVFYKIDCANKSGNNNVNYALQPDVPAALVRSVGGQLANHLRKLGYKVRVIRGTLVVSWV